MSPVRQLAGQSQLTEWTPARLGSTALKMWLDADDAGTFTLSGSEVSTWGDKSGNSRSMAYETITSYRPTRVTSVQNGLAVVRFDGTNDYLTTSSSGVTAQPYSWAGIIKPDAVNVYKRVFQGNTPDGGNLEHNTNATWLMFAGTPVTNIGTAFAAWTILIPTYNGASSTLWVNGTQQGTTHSVGTNTPTKLTLSAPTGGQEFDGDMGEVLFIGGTLATADRERIEGYLAHRWGITSVLPSGHPYKNVKP